MTSNTCKFLFLISFCLPFISARGQSKKVDRYAPKYSRCEVEYCYGRQILSLSDTSKLLLKSCAHSVGCADFFSNAGKWSKEGNKVLLKPSPKYKVIDDLSGNFYEITRDGYSILLHESVLSDSTTILSEAENGFQGGEIYKFLMTSGLFDAEDRKKRYSKFIAEYIEENMTWKYRILVRQP